MKMWIIHYPQLGWLAHPIFKGDYPAVMRKRIDENSRLEKRTYSRLPLLTAKWIKGIKGSVDFLSLNYYTSRLVGELTEAKLKSQNVEIPSWAHDSHLSLTINPKWKQSKAPWIYSVPAGLGQLLRYGFMFYKFMGCSSLKIAHHFRWIKNEYDNPAVIITENGWSDDGRLNDTDRVDYIRDHLKEVLMAVQNDGCNVKGYSVWSLMDNFEWTLGYRYDGTHIRI